jgi:DNA polymerase III delta prime subunit
MDEVWAVKHRPTTLDEFKGQDRIKNEFARILDGEAPMQHYIFHSMEAGTGKTSLAHIIANTLGYAIHKYNASSKRQRGIEFVEEIALMTRLGQYETIFFLDEADQLTEAAQSSLKGVIEDAQGFFILTCNDLSKVSPWLQSRCQVRTFAPIDEKQMMQRLETIESKEGVESNPDHFGIIASSNQGDLRNAINTLQAYHSLPVEDRTDFILSLQEPPLNSHRVLKLLFKEKQVEEAVKMIEGEYNLRKTIDAIFRYGIDSSAEPHNKMRLVDASTQAHRDLIMGVEPHYVVWDFCRRLAE